MLSLRYMHMADVPQVAAIERQSFTMPWPAKSFAYEISEAPYSHMVILEMRQTPQGWKRLLSRAPQQRVLGYGGLWKIGDEGHISTIASHPDYRGQGYGELLLAAMIRRSIVLQAGYIVLEVRVSNTAAKALYDKYEFEVVNIKRGYYHDEDGYAMRLNIEDNQLMVERFNERFAAIIGKYDCVIDTYSDVENPRHNLKPNIPDNLKHMFPNIIGKA